MSDSATTAHSTPTESTPATSPTSNPTHTALAAQFAGLNGCLRGIRVLNFAVNVPGPIAAQRLGLLGAEVTKVEPPSGDPLAQWQSLGTTASLLARGLSTLTSKRLVQQHRSMLCCAKQML